MKTKNTYCVDTGTYWAHAEKHFCCKRFGVRIHRTQDGFAGANECRRLADALLRLAATCDHENEKIRRREERAALKAEKIK
jgi:hypothetical protein